MVTELVAQTLDYSNPETVSPLAQQAAELFVEQIYSKLPGGYQTAKEYIDSVDPARDTHYALAEASRLVVAAFVMHDQNRDTEIFDIVVAPDYEGQEFERKMLAHIASRAIEQGDIFLRVDPTNVATAELAENLGFSAIWEEENDPRVYALPADFAPEGDDPYFSAESLSEN